MTSHDLSGGSFLDTAILSVSSMSEALAFYKDDLGLEIIDTGSWGGSGFESLWGLGTGITANYVFLGSGSDPVGRLLLLDFACARRQLIRNTEVKCAYGLFNLNFYTQDIRQNHRYFSDRGFNFWSSPVQHDFGEQVGQPIEVVFDGPDGVAINPVQLESLKADSLIAEMRGYVEQYGRTSKGFTPVVTSAHFVRDIDAAVEFHEKVLDMRLTIDKELTAPESNHFLGLPEDARTRTVFVQGAHMFGKVCLVKPLNYDCSDMVPLASAPNIGYLSQLFRVPDMDRALAACKDLGVEFFSQPARTEFPSLGQTDIAMVRHPGSGALIQVYRA